MSNESELIQIHAYDWKIKDKYTEDDKTAIHCWGLDKNSKPYLIRFNDFPVYCYIELPKHIWRGNRCVEHNWSKSDATKVFDYINRRLKEHGEETKMELFFPKKVYYYNGNKKYPMIRMIFKNLTAMAECKRILNYPLKTQEWGEIKCMVWENNISVVRKLLTIQGVKYSEWFSVMGVKIVDEGLKISSIENEYMGNWQTMRKIENEECRNWMTQPGILAFDIECYSNNHRAMPDKYDAVHVAYMISAIYQKYQQPETRRRYGVIIGECQDIPEEQLKNCQIIRVNDEFEMIKAFAKIVEETDPEILTGYNILAFDYPYLDHRIKRKLNDWPIMGRMIGEKTEMISKTWKSDAYGHQSINMLDMEGRISIDLLPIIKRDYKLEKYDLSSVSKHFIGKAKHDITPREMFIIYENSKRANKNYVDNASAINKLELEKTIGDTTRVMAYCIQDSELVIDLMENMNIWIGLVEMSNIVGVTIVELFTRGQQVRCQSQLYDLAARNGFVVDEREAPVYNFSGGFVYEPHPGLYENIICLDFQSLYPSIIRAYNICYTTLVPPDEENLVADEDCNILEFDQEEGENEDEDEDEDEKPKKKKKKKQETVTRHYRFKFYKKVEGLLPNLVKLLTSERSAVRAQIGQVKENSKNYKKLYDIYRTIESENSIDNNELLEVINKLKSVDDINLCLSHIDQVVLHIENNNPKEIIKYCNKKEILNCIEKCNILMIVLDKRQLAIKTSSNSFFGFLAVRNGAKMSLMEGAMSITAMGRKLIDCVRVFIENQYGGKQVYGDTDSIRGQTPVLIKYHTGAINYTQIQDLIKLPATTTPEKEYYDLSSHNIEVWTDNGWSKIKYLMRHKTEKKLYRILTHTGIVDVTEDHSLLNEFAQEVTPNQLSLGSKLLHKNLPNIQYANNDMNEDKAWVWGFFMAEGTCGVYECPSRVVCSWSISNQNHDFLSKAQRIMKNIEPDYDFVIDPCMKSSNVDKLNPRGSVIRPLTEKYSKLFYTERSAIMKQNVATELGIRFKKVPEQILMATNNIKQAFLQGWYDGDGAKTEVGSRRFDIKGQIGAAGLFYLASAVGYNVSINTPTDKEEIYRCTLTTKKPRKCTDAIKKIIPLGTCLEDVFDLETENHHFGAGIGRMIVHNSVMMDLHIKDAKECNYWGVKLTNDINGIKPGAKDCDGIVWPEGKPGLFPPPLAMEFEKAMRLLCIKKKKYAAYLINKNGTFQKDKDKDNNEIEKNFTLKKGIVLARRDNCALLRNLYTDILTMILDSQPFERAVLRLIDVIEEFLSNKIPSSDLVIIRGLGANYKSDNYFMKVFSDRLKRDGKIVNPGDRLDYVVVENSKTTVLGEKMVLFSQYSEKIDSDSPYVIDYLYYIEKMLMNPINQLFQVGFKSTIDTLSYSYRRSNRCKLVKLDCPVKIIFDHLLNGLPLTLFKTNVLNCLHPENIPPVVPPKLTIKLNPPPPPVGPPKLTIKLNPPPPPVGPPKLTIKLKPQPPPVKIILVTAKPILPVVSPPVTPNLKIPRFALNLKN